MPNPTKLIVDCSTGITTEVELTDAEVAQREADAKAYEADKKAKEVELAAQAKVKADVLKRLGLTEDEAKALLS
jgi:regulator of protease activity HflC (stomatin/prohibitin superfamily)